nr:hypothetical protein [Bacilli bacterium]
MINKNFKHIDAIDVSNNGSRLDVLTDNGLYIYNVSFATPVIHSYSPRMQKAVISLNGQIISRPYRTVINGANYLPISSVESLLHRIGITAVWNGSTKVWSMTISAKPSGSLSIDGKTGSAAIRVNGQTVENHVPITVLKDPSTGVESVYMPVWFIQQTLNNIGFKPSTDIWISGSSTPIWTLYWSK